MKLLFDQNLSHRLITQLADLFPSAQHVRFVGLHQSPDDEIWNYAKANGYCIVTQDVDFVERSRLHGSPPKVVWLRCGNRTPKYIESLLRQNAILLIELMQNPLMDYAEIF